MIAPMDLRRRPHRDLGSWRGRLAAAGTLLALVVSSGCSGSHGSSSGAAEGEQVRITARALAYIAAEHAGTPDSAAEADGISEQLPSRGVGAELRYGSDGEYDGDVLVVATGKGLDPERTDCESPKARALDGCVTTRRGTLLWEEEAPEEDPGFLVVVAHKGTADVMVTYAGPRITGDPRRLRTPIPTDALFAIADDDRVDVTTTAQTVEAGEGLSFWRPRSS